MKAAETKSEALYTRIAGMTKREKIEAGAMVYTAGFVLPAARAAGVYDELVADHGFLEIHPAVEACYDTIISGVATEMIPRLFLTGSWGNPVPENATDELAVDSTEFPVLHALRVRGIADEAAIADSSGLDVAAVTKVIDESVERGHAKRLKGRISGARLTPSGAARHVLLLSDAVSPEARRALGGAYESFLAPNRAFKQLTTDWQLRATSGTPEDGLRERLTAIDAEVLGVLDEATGVEPWFGAYKSRFRRAFDKFQAGDADALAKPMSGSYHDVWMELHEDLLSTLGRVRTDADE